ncbi:lysophospholipase [Spiroplasma clarkii]|uniref:alpha/beta hydrolase n=1 Tax=Spiroplasma clarkii TaxID=2139 RepID=UPI000B56E3CB|nr:alpha/beta fold hydrolase [Spiroplasma clarkii]ARU91468.1 lysophospholipase [Spiroplasma clarkii]
MKEIKIKSFDEKELHTSLWDDVEKPVGVLQLVHGSCEHAFRYNDFASTLNKNGWIVVANDHRGHGKTADLANNELGYLADDDGWNTIIHDLKIVNDFIKKTYPNLKIVMLGHSMGSFMARTYLIDYPETLSGCVLSGTAWHSKFVLKFGTNVAKKNQKKFGPKHIDKYIWKLSYRPLNKKFKKKELQVVSD